MKTKNELKLTTIEIVNYLISCNKSNFEFIVEDEFLKRKFNLTDEELSFVLGKIGLVFDVIEVDESFDKSSFNGKIFKGEIL